MIVQQVQDNPYHPNYCGPCSECVYDRAHRDYLREARRLPVDLDAMALARAALRRAGAALDRKQPA